MMLRGVLRPIASKSRTSAGFSLRPTAQVFWGVVE